MNAGPLASGRTCEDDRGDVLALLPPGAVPAAGGPTLLGVHDLDGLDRDWPAAGSAGPTVVLTPEPDHLVLVRALELGAVGYTSVTRAPDELRECLAAVGRGEVFVPPAMLGGLLSALVVRRPQPLPALDPRLARLSRRERQVLRALTRGGNHRTIAVELVISPQTARTHIQNVIVKLGVNSRLEAVTLALAAGLPAEESP